MNFIRLDRAPVKPQTALPWRVSYFTLEGGEEKTKLFGSKQERNDWIRANGRHCVALTKHKMIDGVKHFGV